MKRSEFLKLALAGDRGADEFVAREAMQISWPPDFQPTQCVVPCYATCPDSDLPRSWALFGEMFDKLLPLSHVAIALTAWNPIRLGYRGIAVGEQTNEVLDVPRCLAVALALCEALGLFDREGEADEQRDGTETISRRVASRRAGQVPRWRETPRA